MADEHAVELRALRQLVQPRHELGAERLACRRQRSGRKGMHLRRHLRLLPQPTLTVAADARGGRQGLEQLCGLARPRPKGGVVAPEQIRRRPYTIGFGKDGLERHEIAVDVVEQRRRH